MPDATLKRRIGPGLLTAYGVGVMVGAGIYVLVGEVAGLSGIYAPVAFLLAGLVALPSALSYAELSVRMPEAAGEVAFVEAGTGLRWLGLIVGLAIVLSGTLSAAAVLRGGAGYLTSIVGISPEMAIIAGGVLIATVAIVGVLESLAVAAIFTLAEVLGLALVIWAGLGADPVSVDWAAAPAPFWPGIFAAVTLCFFAFIGFEDIVNLAEETRDPDLTMPRAILWALAITAVLYAAVSYAAVRAVPIEALSSSQQPLALVWQVGTGNPAAFLSAIAVAAAVNGVLAQIVMAARVLYGLGRRHGSLRAFSGVGARFGTPHLATILIGAGVIGAALVLPVGQLAGLTSLVLLSVFVLVNLSLILIKRHTPAARFRVGAWVPVAGLLMALGALILWLWGALA